MPHCKCVIETLGSNDDNGDCQRLLDIDFQKWTDMTENGKHFQDSLISSFARSSLQWSIPISMCNPCTYSVTMRRTMCHPYAIHAPLCFICRHKKNVFIVWVLYLNSNILPLRCSPSPPICWMMSIVNVVLPFDQAYSRFALRLIRNIQNEQHRISKECDAFNGVAKSLVNNFNGNYMIFFFCNSCNLAFILFSVIRNDFILLWIFSNPTEPLGTMTHFGNFLSFGKRMWGRRDGE